MSDTTSNAFLDGRVMARQPARGFRAGVDSVLVAAAVPARAGDTVLELGCGVGVASLCLAARVPVDIVGVEREPEYAELAAQNVTDAGAKMRVVCANVETLPNAVRELSFDHVFTNPPYFRSDTRTESTSALREAAMAENTSLDTWITVGAKRCKPKGTLTLIQSAIRLQDVLVALSAHAGSVTIQPIASRIGRPAHLAIVQWRKGAKAPLQLNAALILHEGTQHMGDKDSYTKETVDILRKGSSIDLRA